MSTMTTATIELELQIEVWWDGKLQTNVFGVNPTRGLTGLVSEPIPEPLREHLQKLIDDNQDIQDDCALALAEKERMSA